MQRIKHLPFVLTARELAQSIKQIIFKRELLVWRMHWMHQSAFLESDRRISTDSSENQTTRHIALGLWVTWSILSSEEFIPGKLERLITGTRRNKADEVFGHKTCNLYPRVSVWVQTGFKFVWFSNFTWSGEFSKPVKNRNFHTLMNDCWSLGNLKHLLHSSSKPTQRPTLGSAAHWNFALITTKEMFSLFADDDRLFFPWVIEDSTSRLRS